ncbi:MAG TPA: hypothetical protein PLZ95_12585, partial [Bryobacteraceae bacterium]|nr:hypothetical protein [Bryobacteraceae bacterium]
MPVQPASREPGGLSSLRAGYGLVSSSSDLIAASTLSIQRRSAFSRSALNRAIFSAASGSVGVFAVQLAKHFGA